MNPNQAEQLLSIQSAQIGAAALKKALAGGGGGGGDPGVAKDYVDEQIDGVEEDIATLQHDVARDYVTKSDANKTYLRDGFTSNELCINRTAGGDIDSMKVTAITGGAAVWRLDCKAGTDGPVIYKTEGSGSHQFNGKVNLTRVGDGVQGFKIQGRKTDGTIGDLFHVFHNADNLADAVNYSGKITSAKNIVNKEYVDNAVGTGSAASEVIRPAQLSWLFEGDMGGDNHAPPDGYFRKTSNSGSTYIRFSFLSHNGCDLGDGKFDDTNVSFSDGPVGTIWENKSGKWKLKRQFRVASWRWNYQASGDTRSHFEFKCSSENGRDWDEFAEGTEYFITVGGFF